MFNSIHQTIAKIKSREIKPSDWLKACLLKIEALNPILQAVSHVNYDYIHPKAKELDLVDDFSSQLLLGAPIGVKDIINTSTNPNNMGSRVRVGYWPGNNSRVVDSMLLSGGYAMCKTATAEFAVHEPPATLNPRDFKRHAGTSSTGSAVAVATGMVPAALGTQSAASIIRPASYNGIVGFKPSFGLLPRTGILKTCDTLDTVGFLTSSVLDSQLLLDALRVKGANYPILEQSLAYCQNRAAAKQKLIVAKVKVPGWENIHPHVKNEFDKFLKTLDGQDSIEVVELDLQNLLQIAHSVHATIYNKSLSYYFKRELGSSELISPLFNKIVKLGQNISFSEFQDAVDRQAALSDYLEEVFSNVDFLMTPSVAGEAPLSTEVEKNDAGLIWTLAGVPVISLPLLQGENNLPVGISLIGSKYSDYPLLHFAHTKLLNSTLDIILPKRKQIFEAATFS